MTQQSGAAMILRSDVGTEPEPPETVGLLEIGIDRQRLDFSTADQIVAGVVAELSVGDFKKRLVGAGINRVAIEIAQIVVVRLNRAEHVVPYDFGGNVRIVRIDQREWLSGDITDDGA